MIIDNIELANKSLCVFWVDWVDASPYKDGILHLNFLLDGLALFHQPDSQSPFEPLSSCRKACRLDFQSSAPM